MDWNGLATTKGPREKWIAYATERQKELGSFLQFDPVLGAADSVATGPLAGVPCAVKDNIAVKGFHLTCGSKMLRDFVSPYTATAVERLQKQAPSCRARRISTSSAWAPRRKTPPFR